jgi:hypothetical protein
MQRQRIFATNAHLPTPAIIALFLMHATALQCKTLKWTPDTRFDIANFRAKIYV